MKKLQIKLLDTPTKADVEDLINRIFEQAQEDAVEYNLMRKRTKQGETYADYESGVAETYRYVLAGIAYWAMGHAVELNMDLEKWTEENLM